ncbi:hypothetical protein QTP70_007259 [Hemibagrus guttatus]|uniref:Uncharacterized protein n=1 Tax=Hemibagrus guttatus TaxID=175788 RepID=A0AAE0QS71_9TELE|nr:hypothetical protein QTP70_007259 [Hemibagrus guttatus]
MEQWRTFPGAAGRPKLPQECSDNSSRRSQKTPQQHPKNCRPHLPQLRPPVPSAPPSPAQGRHYPSQRNPRLFLIFAGARVIRVAMRSSSLFGHEGVPGSAELRVIVLLEDEPSPQSEVQSTLEQVFIKDVSTLLHSSFPRS